MQALQKLALHWRRRVTSRLTRDDAPSAHPIALMVPVAPKDIRRARVSLPLMQARIAHPLTRVAIVAPAGKGVEEMCADIGVEFIDETAPLSRIGDPDGMPGWLKQQMLKLTAPEVMDAEDVLVMDSDTYPLRPVTFMDPYGRRILYNGDPNLSPFHGFTETVFGPLPFAAHNFVAHCMLFHQPWLMAMRARIEALHDGTWVDTMLRLAARPVAEVGQMSEFDMCGQFVTRTFPDQVRERWYAGIKAAPEQFLGERPLPRWKRRFRFVSNHERI